LNVFANTANVAPLATNATCLNWTNWPWSSCSNAPAFWATTQHARVPGRHVDACSFDKKSQTVRVVAHRIFTPKPDDPIDFEATVGATLLELKRRFRVRKVYYDPFQMAASAQRLTKAGIKLESFRRLCRT
jgi:phage terminase large subunit-like protein